MAKRKILFILIAIAASHGIGIPKLAAAKRSQADTRQQSLEKQRLANEFFDYIQNISDYLADKTPREFGMKPTDLQCIVELRQLTDDWRKRKFWALKMVDAWGSLPSGLLIGNLVDFGNFDECVAIRKTLSNDRTLQGKYCLATLPVEQLLDDSVLRNYVHVQTGICIPATCTAAYLDKMFRNFLDLFFEIKINSTIGIVNENSCSVREPSPLSGVAIAAIAVLSLLAALALLSTIWDYLTRSSHENLHPLISAFSLRVNAQQLFQVIDYSNNPNVIPSLNGIRCLSIIWVIFGHSFLTHITSPNMNSYDMLDWIQTPFAMLIAQAFFSVDTFFFISGLLLVLLALREMDRTRGKLNVPLMYLHRYLRLTPVLAFGIIACMTTKYFSDGPLWEANASIGYEQCGENWWATILYVQNYAYPLTMCLSHTWYLAVDMQLYILSPILLFALWKWGKKAVGVIFLLMLLMWACLFSTIMCKDYSLFYKRYGNVNETMKHIYFPTHTRTSPWLIGIMFGYFLHTTRGLRIKLSKLAFLTGWSACLVLIATCLFCMLPKSQMSAAPLTTLEEALFVSLTRIAWPFALCWVVFAGVHGYGGPAETFLSSPLWQPLARISYCTYIFHTIIVNTNGARIKTNLHFSSYDLMLRFWPDFGFTILLSTVIYLLVEAPIAGIMTSVLKQKKPTKSQSTETVLSSQIISKTPMPDAKLSSYL